ISASLPLGRSLFYAGMAPGLGLCFWHGDLAAHSGDYRHPWAAHHWQPPLPAPWSVDWCKRLGAPRWFDAAGAACAIRSFGRKNCQRHPPPRMGHPAFGGVDAGLPPAVSFAASALSAWTLFDACAGRFRAGGSAWFLRIFAVIAHLSNAAGKAGFFNGNRLV